MIETILTSKTPEGVMRALVKHLPGETDRLAVIFHDGPGVRADIEDVARRFAVAGFLAIVPDLYYRTGEFLSFETKPGGSDVNQMLMAIGLVTQGDLEADIAALLEAVRDGYWSGDFAVCVGFCLGASAVFRAMSMPGTPFLRGAGFHPSFCVTDEPHSPHRAVESIAGDLYVAFGEADEVSPLDANAPLLEALSRLGTRATVDVHPGVGHGFMLPRGRHFDQAAATRSWAKTETMFAGTFDDEKRPDRP